MPAIVKLNKQGLNDLIDNIKTNGGDCPELDDMRSEIIEDERQRRPVKRRERTLRVMVEEPTTAEFLEAEVGGLFPEGITAKVLADVIEYARNYTLKELKKKCREAGLSPSGEKKELAAKLMARGIE